MDCTLKKIRILSSEIVLLGFKNVHFSKIKTYFKSLKLVNIFPKLNLSYIFDTNIKFLVTTKKKCVMPVKLSDFMPVVYLFTIYYREMSMHFNCKHFFDKKM